MSQKYDIELSLLNWLIYSLYEEDVKTRNAKWGQNYLGLRPIMWDMTNLPAYSFSDADFQQFTYSECYGENCFKGGVSVQLNSWIQEGALWTGRVSDSDYNRREGYLQKQQEFQEIDLVEIDGKLDVLPFLNVYDKGYRASTVAWKTRNQGVLQPTFAPRKGGSMEEKQNSLHPLHLIVGGMKEQLMLAKGRHILVKVSGQIWIQDGSTLHGRPGISRQTSCSSRCCKITD